MYGNPNRGRFLALGLGFATGACIGQLDDPSRFDVGAGSGGADQGPGCDALAILTSETVPQGCAQASCHSSVVAARGLNLQGPELFQRLSTQLGQSCSGRPLIDVNDPASSLLYNRLTDMPCGGGRMPSGAPELSDEEAQCVLEWIQAQAGTGSNGGGPTDMGPNIQDAGANDAGMVVGGLEVEAETMSLTAPMATAVDPMNPGVSYIAAPSDSMPYRTLPLPLTEVGRASHTFNLSTAGNTWIFALARATDFNNDSFWVRMDGGEWVNWNALFFVTNGTWVWDDVHDYIDDDNLPTEVYNLSAGTHTVEFAIREPGAEIDRIIITQNPNFTPPPP